MSLQQHAAVNPMEINEAHARIRDAQNSCREARDRLACLLLEARRQTLLQAQAAMPARLELLTFVSRMTSAFTQEQDANVTMHRPTPIKNNRAVFV